MGYLHENNMWGRVNDAWVTSLLPVGALVHIVPRKAKVLVLKTNAAAALCWPAGEVAHCVWRKSLGSLLWSGTPFSMSRMWKF